MDGYVPVLGLGDDELTGVMIVGSAFTFALAVVIISAIKTVITTRMRETTAREMAAYVAEGTMTQDEAERLLIASATPKGRCGS